MVRVLRLVVPFLILGVGAFGAWKLIESRPDVAVEEPVRVVPLVRAVLVEPESYQFTVRSQGTVVPRRETELVAEVAGRVVYVSPSLAAGGFFEEGEVLLRIDSRDYELLLIRSESEVARARLRLEQEEAEAEVARAEWEELGSGSVPTDLVLRLPQMAEAKAVLQAAEATLEQARLDLKKTEVRAPYSGRVRSETVDIGQFVNRGTRVAQIYAVDVAEVRLPLPDRELAYVNIPLTYRGENQVQSGPSVTIQTEFAGRKHQWSGRIVRTEGEIDPQTRMLYAVAEVADPYGRGSNPSRPPLAVGLFVEAEIYGRRIDTAIVLPRAALRSESTVYVVRDGRLEFREVEVIRSEAENVIIGSGLESGEMVCVSPLETVVDGMAVEIVREERR